MVVIKRAVALLLMTILITMNGAVAYAVEPGDLDIVTDDSAASTAVSSTEEKAEKKKDDEPVSENSQETDTVVEENKSDNVVSQVPGENLPEEEASDVPVIIESQMLENLPLEDLPLQGQPLEDQLIDNKLLAKQPLQEKDVPDFDHDVAFISEVLALIMIYQGSL